MAISESRPEPIAPRYATIGDRLFAQLVDGLIAVGIFFLFGRLLASRFGQLAPVVFDLPLVLWIILLMLVVLVMIAYFVVTEAFLGATLGKIVAEARVQTASGRTIGYEASLIRNAMRLIDAIGFYLVGGVAALVTPRRQRLGDLLARTYVTHRPTGSFVRGITLLVAAGITVGAIVAGLAVHAPTEPSGPPRIASATVTDEPSGAISKPSFSPDTKQIYVVFSLADAPANTAVKANWFAPGGASLGEAELRTGGIRADGSFALSMPPTGWAPGEYRVDLLLNGLVARTERFGIEAAAGASPVAAPSAIPGQGSPTVR